MPSSNSVSVIHFGSTILRQANTLVKDWGPAPVIMSWGKLPQINTSQEARRLGNWLLRRAEVLEKWETKEAKKNRLTNG